MTVAELITVLQTLPEHHVLHVQLGQTPELHALESVEHRRIFTGRTESGIVAFRTYTKANTR